MHDAKDVEFKFSRLRRHLKGQLKRWGKLTSIARLWSPENGFEGIFEKFVFVLEIWAVKVEELCGTNSRLSSFSEKILSGDFCLWRHWWYLLWVRSWPSYWGAGFSFFRARIQERLFGRFYRIFRQWAVVCPEELQGMRNLWNCHILSPHFSGPWSWTKYQRHNDHVLVVPVQADGLFDFLTSLLQS